MLPYQATAQEKKADKPNIIFILTDDLGYGDIGVFFQNQRKSKDDPSEPWTSTPQLDQMAAEGAILTHHYAAAPVCAPSRGSLLTGRSQGHANVRDNQFDKALEDNHTLGNVMQDAGYITAAIGKWGLQGNKKWSENGDNWPGRPNKRGFDYFYGYMRHEDGHEHYPKEGIYRGKKEVWENEKEVSAAVDKSYTADLWTAAAKNWIKNTVQDQNKPFFMYLAYDTPHAVLELPTQAYPKGGGLNGGLQWTRKKGHIINTASGEPDSFVEPEYANATYDDDHDKSTAEVPWPETYKRYATDVRRIDHAVGDIIQLLKDLNIDDNTLVVFSSDNGPADESYLPKGYVRNTPDFFNSFGPFDGIKRDVLEGGERMPTIVRWPSHIAPKQEIELPSISYDWLPTFTDAVGLPAPANSDGTSLLPSLTWKGDQETPLIYSEYFQGQMQTPGYQDFSKNNRNRTRNQMQMIRKGDLVGIRYDIKSQDDDFEIYNVIADPQQSTNLAGDSLTDLQQWMKDKVTQVRRPDPQAPRPYDSIPLRASKVEGLKEGIQWYAFTGDYPWLPKMDKLTTSEKGIAQNLNEITYKSSSAYYMLKGYLKISETGTYNFQFSAKEKGFIRVHGAALFDADYGYQPNTLLQAKINLQKGIHPITIYLQNSSKEIDPFTLEWKKGGSSKIWDVGLFYYVP